MEEIPPMPPSLVRSDSSATTVPYHWVDDSVCICMTASGLVWSEAYNACVCTTCFCRIDPYLD